MSRKATDIEKYGIKEIPCNLCHQDRPIGEFYLAKTGSYASYCRTCYNKNQRQYKLKNPEIRLIHHLQAHIKRSKEKIIHHTERVERLEKLLERKLQLKSIRKGILQSSPVHEAGLQTVQDQTVQCQEAGGEQTVLPGSETIYQRAS